MEITRFSSHWILHVSDVRCCFFSYYFITVWCLLVAPVRTNIRDQVTWVKCLLIKSSLLECSMFGDYQGLLWSDDWHVTCIRVLCIRTCKYFKFFYWWNNNALQWQTNTKECSAAALINSYQSQVRWSQAWEIRCFQVLHLTFICTPPGLYQSQSFPLGLCINWNTSLKYNICYLLILKNNSKSESKTWTYCSWFNLILF